MKTALFSEKIGKGPDLVLIHGWGFHSGIWKTVLPRLTKNYTVTLLDLPGFGRTKWIPKNYDLKTLSQLVLEVAPENATWLGWSLGGLIAMYAASYTSQVKKLICVGSSPKFLNSDDWPGMQKAVLMQFSKGLHEDFRGTLSQFLALQMPRQSTSEAKQNLKFLKEEMFRYGEPDKQALLSGLEILEKTDLRTELSKITCPSLFLFGKLDALVPVRVADIFAEQWPTIKTSVISGANHAPFLSHEALFLKAVNE